MIVSFRTQEHWIFNEPDHHLERIIVCVIHYCMMQQILDWSMIKLICIFKQIYMRMFVSKRIQEHWMFDGTHHYEWFYGFSFTSTSWINIVTKQCCSWLVYLSEYTWECLCSDGHKNIEYLMWHITKNESLFVWFICSKWIK